MTFKKSHHNLFTTKLALCFLPFFGLKSLQSQNIEVTFSGIRSSVGQIRLEVFIDEESFEKEKGIAIKRFKKSNLINGEMTVKLDLPPGTYGLALLDDENIDDKMNYSFVGWPKEGFGFSNYYLSGLFKPKFEDFKFTIYKDQKRRVFMKIKYM